MPASQATASLLRLARVNHRRLQFREGLPLVILRLLQLLQQLCFEQLQLFGLLLICGDLVGEDGTLLLNVLTSLLVLVVEELLTLLVALTLLLFNFAFALLRLILHLLFGEQHLLLRILLRHFQLARLAQLVRRLPLSPNLKLCFLLGALVLQHLLLVVVFGVAPLLLHQSLLKLHVVLAHARADLRGFLLCVGDLLAGACFLLLQHPHAVLQLKYVLLQFEADGARLGIG